jgi:hypothetical protein
MLPEPEGLNEFTQNNDQSHYSPINGFQLVIIGSSYAINAS